MEWFQSVIVIIAMFISLIIIDFLWLGIILKDFIINQFGSLIKVDQGSITINIWAGLLAWFIIAVGVFIFAVNPSSSLVNSILLGALLGFVIYGVYDLTNLTFLLNYPKLFVIVDIAWGTFVCGVISAIGFIVKNILS